MWPSLDLMRSTSTPSSTGASEKRDCSSDKIPCVRLRRSRAVASNISPVFLADHAHLSRRNARRRRPRSGSSRYMMPAPSPSPVARVNPLFIDLLSPYSSFFGANLRPRETREYTLPIAARGLNVVYQARSQEGYTCRKKRHLKEPDATREKVRRQAR